MEINIQRIIKIAKDAGDEIMKIYETDFKTDFKKDSSFRSGFSILTEADRIANSLIVKKLKELYPGIPILSEESDEIPYEKRKEWKKLWIVDPLDGTKEFVNKTGEFTVNIALIENNKPVLGVIYIPVGKIAYYGDENGAFKEEDGNVIKLPLNEKNQDKLRVASTKSHFNENIDNYIKNIKNDYEVVYAGSSLKLCWVAEGKADIYPRLGPTKEWDIAAGHAILCASGKRVYDFETGEELKYNKKNLLNPWFVAE